MPSLRHKRGTLAQIDAAATAGALRQGEVYLVTDQNRLTVGTAVNAHEPLAKQSEAGGAGGGVCGAHAQYPIALNEFAHFAVNGSALTTIAAAANRLDLIPFIPSKNINVDQLSVEVITLVAASQARLAIYTSDVTGGPGSRLVDGASILDCATVGNKTTTIPATTLTAGVTYWIAILSSATQAYRGVAQTGLMPLSGDATANAMHTLRRATSTFASGIPATAPSTTRTAAIAPHIRLRRAA